MLCFRIPFAACRIATWLCLVDRFVLNISTPGDFRRHAYACLKLYLIFTAVSSQWREEEGIINRDLNSINQTEINLPR